MSTTKTTVLFLIVLFRNVAPILPCATVPPATSTTTTTTTTSTSTATPCRFTNNIGLNGLSGFAGNCTNSACTVNDGETFTINQDACALRGVNRPFRIDGSDLPAPGVAPTQAATVTCNNGVLSSTGGAVDNNIQTIDCSQDCVLDLNLNAGENGIQTEFGNCAVGTSTSGAGECLIDNNGNEVTVSMNLGTDLCTVTTENIAFITAGNMAIQFPAAGGGVAAQDLELTCNADGTVTAAVDGVVQSTNVVGIDCLED